LKTIRIKAAPGKLILKFPDFPDEEQKSEGGIFMPASSIQIPEIAEVVDVGEPLDDEERRYAAYFRERKEKEQGVLADYAAGQILWKRNYDPGRWGWLKPLRIYRLSSPSAHLELTENEDVA
jgi:co-chaperonin GroES (HSP10)